MYIVYAIAHSIVQKFVEDTNRNFHIEDMAKSVQVVSEETEPPPAIRSQNYLRSINQQYCQAKYILYTNINVQIANYVDMRGSS